MCLIKYRGTCEHAMECVSNSQISLSYMCVMACAYHGMCLNLTIGVCLDRHAPQFNLTQAFAWSTNACKQARALFGERIFSTPRALTMSSAYSGIGTVEQSSHQVCSSINSLEGSAHHCVTPLWASEKDTASPPHVCSVT